MNGAGSQDPAKADIEDSNEEKDEEGGNAEAGPTGGR